MVSLTDYNWTQSKTNLNRCYTTFSCYRAGNYSFINYARTYGGKHDKNLQGHHSHMAEQQKFVNLFDIMLSSFVIRLTWRILYIMVLIARNATICRGLLFSPNNIGSVYICGTLPHNNTNKQTSYLSYHTDILLLYSAFL